MQFLVPACKSSEDNSSYFDFMEQLALARMEWLMGKGCPPVFDGSVALVAVGRLELLLMVLGPPHRPLFMGMP